MSMDFLPPPETLQEDLSLPLVQWVQKDPKVRGEGIINATGGFFTTEPEIPGFVPCKMILQDGTDVTGYGTATITAAILWKRERWVVSQGDNYRVFRFFRDAEDELGPVLARKGKSKVQVALWIQGHTEPVALTISGMTANAWKYVELAVSEYAQLATRLRRAKRKDPAAPKVPPYTFWVEIGVGDGQVVGKVEKKTIYPMAVKNPLEGDGVARKMRTIAAYVTDSIAELHASWIIDTGIPWAKKWHIPRNDDAPVDDGGNEPPPPDEPW